VSCAKTAEPVETRHLDIELTRLLFVVVVVVVVVAAAAAAAAVVVD